MRSTRVQIVMLADWDGMKKGEKLIARSGPFGCRIIEGEHAKKEIGKSKYKVKKVLPETSELALGAG